MKLTARNIHRDLAYLYLGLIISFSISGIFLNHRRTWHPMRYEYASNEIQLNQDLMVSEKLVDNAYIDKFTESVAIEDQLRRFAVDKGVLRVSYGNHEAEVDLSTGKGTIGEYRKTPLLGQMTELHVTTNNWWIYYSDIFGIAMLTIAITGMFIAKGSGSFKNRGWKLAVAGIIFPLIFLFLLA